MFNLALWYPALYPTPAEQAFTLKGLFASIIIFAPRFKNQCVERPKPRGWGKSVSLSLGWGSLCRTIEGLLDLRHGVSSVFSCDFYRSLGAGVKSLFTLLLVQSLDNGIGRVTVR